jgi:hypothetical protein
VVKKAGDAFLASLDGITIDDLCRRAEADAQADRAALADFAI